MSGRITKHWSHRVLERIGSDTDPVALWESIHDAIDACRSDQVQYLGRNKCSRRRQWRFQVPDGRAFVAITVDSCAGLVPLTVIPARPEGGRQ